MPRRLATWLLAAGLTLFAAAKLSSTYDPTYALPIELYYGAAIFELALAALLLTRFARLAAFGCGVFFLVAIVSAFFYAGDCGCLGGYAAANRGVRILLGSAGGMLAVIVWQLHATAAATATPAPYTQAGPSRA